MGPPDQGDKISHNDTEDDHIDMVDNHIDVPYRKLISSIPNRYSYQYLFMSDLPYRSPISISDHILSLCSTLPMHIQLERMWRSRLTRPWLQSPRLYHHFHGDFDPAKFDEASIQKPKKFVAVLSHNYTPEALKVGLRKLCLPWSHPQSKHHSLYPRSMK